MIKRNYTKCLTTLLACCVLSGASHASAYYNDSIRKVPSHADFDYLSTWHDWPVVGEAKLRVFLFDIYTSQLRAPDGRYRLGFDVTPHPVSLSITYERDISREQLLDETVNQWQRLGYSDRQIQQWRQQLASIYPDIREGDKLIYITDGDSGSFIYEQTRGSVQRRGEIDEEAFNDAFLAIWLSPDTEYPKQRRQLIGMTR